MASVNAGASSPKTRGTGIGKIPAATEFNNSNDYEYTLAERRAQRLSRMFGIAGRRAHLIASLAYEVRS